MPLYDFRCAGCHDEREVRAPFGETESLQLICTNCGGTMTRVLSRTATIVLAVSGSASSSPPSPIGGRKNQRTCEDGAVRLTQPNPFAGSLPARDTDTGGRRA
jgi:putative FmdB family regulatory protein